MYPLALTRFTGISKQSINAYFDGNVTTKNNAIPDSKEQSRHIGLNDNGCIKKQAVLVSIPLSFLH